MAEKYHRVQFDIVPEAMNELERLQTVLGLNTKAQVIRYAMQVMRWMVEQAQAGNSVLVDKNGRLQEVIFPFLSPIAAAAAPRERRPREKEAAMEYDKRRTQELLEELDELVERGKPETAAPREDAAPGAVKSPYEANIRGGPLKNRK